MSFIQFNLSITDQHDLEENIENISANDITLNKTEDESTNLQVKPVANEKQTESQFLEAEEILDEENSDESKVLKCTKCDEGFSTLVDLAYHQNSAHAKSGIEVYNLGHILSEQHRRVKIDPSFLKGQ